MQTKTDKVATSEEVAYYSVSIEKFVIFSIISFGIYNLYWIYKNWQALKKQQQSSISPAWRTAFIFFYAHILFKQVLKNTQLRGYTQTYSSVWLAVIYIFLLILSTVLSLRLPGTFYTNLGWYVSSIICFWPMLPVASATNFYNDRIAPERIAAKEKLTGNQILFVSIFGFIFAWITFSMFIIR